MRTSPPHFASRLLMVAAGLTALTACSAEPAPMPADAAATDVAPMEDAGADDAPVVAPPDATRDAAPDAPTTCVDVSGAWEWTATCNNPAYTLEPSTCSVQTGCSVTDIFTLPGTVAGNTVTRPLDRRLEGATGTITIVYSGDTATLRLVSTTPAVTCMGTGRRLTFPGASRSCCSVRANDCGAGQRCAPVEAGRSFFTACIAAGATTAGMSCSRAMNRVGADGCAAGLTCAEDYRVSPLASVCQTACEGSGQCAGGDFCRAYTPRPPVGFCNRGCALRGSDCPAGSTCRPLAGLGASAVSAVEYVAGCDRAGPRTEGMPCARHEECGEALACFLPPTGGTLTSGTCRPVCDMTRPCPAGSFCFQYFNYHGYSALNGAGVGACVPM